MKRKVPVRLLSFLLAGVLTVSSVQMPVYASEAVANQEADAGGVIGEGTSEGEPDIEIEEADLSTEQAPESAPGDTVAEDDADPGDFGADLSESGASEESGEITASGETEVAEDIEPSESEESTDAEAGEAEDEEDMDTAAEGTQDTASDPTREGEEETYEVIGNLNTRIYVKGEKNFDTSGPRIVSSSGKQITISSASCSDFNPNNVGRQDVTITYEGGGITVEATRKVLVISPPEGLTAEYGQIFSDIAMPLNPEYGEWSWSDGSKKLTEVGSRTYALDFTANELGVYGDKTVNVKVAVTCSLTRPDVKVNVNVPAEGYTYDGKRKEPTVTVTVDGMLTPLMLNTDYTVAYGDNTNAGEDSGSVSITGDGVYYLDSKKINFPIAKAKLTFKAQNKTIYSKRDPVPTKKDFDYVFEGSGLVSKEDLKDLDYDCDIENTDEPGAKYLIIPKNAVIADAVKDNYVSGSDIKYEPGVLEVKEFEPTKIELVGVTAASREYNREIWTFSRGSNFGLQTVKQGNTGGEPVYGLSVVPSYSFQDGSEYKDSSVAPTDVGDYILTFTLRGTSGTSVDDYELVPTSASYTFRIIPKKLTVTALPYTVKPGEDLPILNDETTGAAKSEYYQIGKVLQGDKQESVINTAKLKLKYDVENISPDMAGEFKIEPYEESEDPAIIDTNYILDPVPGTLIVEGKLELKYDFSDIKVPSITYNGQKHSISGSLTGEETYRIIVTGNTRDTSKEFVYNWEEKKDPEEGDDSEEGDSEEGDDLKEETPEEGGDQTYNYRKRLTGISPTEIVNKYQEIAPTEVGVYTLEIYSEVDTKKYNYDGRALRKIRFSIFPLKTSETKLVGVTGVANKIYDGKITDLTEAIRNAKVWTKQDVDITDLIEDNGKLGFWIKGYTPENSEEDKPEESPFKDRKYYLSTPIEDKMPSNAGEYELVVRIEADKAQNYDTNEWSIPFVIKPRPLTVTVNDMKMLVNADGTLPDPAEYTYTITDGTITDEDKKVLPNTDFPWLKIKIEPLGIEDTRTTGSYDLVATSDVGENDKAKESNYDIEYVPGKLFVQSQLLEVKELNLTNNKNIPHGTTLEEIADKYLPKTVVIYLVGYKTVGDEIIEETVEGKATIEWDTDKPSAGVYKIDSTSAQNFKMKGTVVLPDLVGGVTEKNEEMLTVEVDVSVREPDDGTRAMRPYANIKSGTVGAGTTVSLYTDEEGAEIYYTIEADNPSLSVTSRRYTSPIEIKCTMTIRAVARIYGKLDSEELRLTYYYDKNYRPGGPDDPDDPNGPTVPDDDVPKDEDGNPLEIPKGMWITDVAPITYTGSAITPQVRVYDYKTRLEENKDYTISYKNNVNAADKNEPKKAPSIVIKGKGNYEGTISKTFTIAPKDINDMHEENGRKVYDVKMDDITVAFVEKKAQKPVVAVSWNGKKLVNKKDYIYEAYPYTAVGNYPVTVTGNGNYKGERQITFTITNALPASLFTVEKIADYNYTGQEIKPMVVVMYQKAVVSPGLEYDISYEDNVEIGTASVVIKGKGRFAGVKRVNFKIKVPAMLNKADVELVFASGTVYTGSAIEPSEIKMAVQVNNNGAMSTKVLTKDDYKVTYQNNVKAGTATAVFEGAGAYKGTGTLKKTFKITPYNIQNLQPEQITVRSTYPYMKGGSAQKPVVQFDGKTLREGTDYTLSYKNNTKVGSTAVVTIKGKGNFTGSVMRTYQVTVQDISNTKVIPTDKVYKAKAGNYKTTVRVLDTNGKALAAGKDYDKNVVYTYAERTTLSADVVKEAGDPVGELDMIPVGTRLRVTVTAVGSNYQGTAMGMFTIVQADVSKAKVTVPTMTYTGKAIEPKKSEIVVMLNGIPLAAEDYQITGYSNNLNTGTAKLTIQGQGNYGGTKTVSFKIKKKSLIAQLFG